MTPYHSFYPGLSVVCVDDTVPLEGGRTVKDANITEGQTYTLRWVGMASHYVFGDYFGVKLVGVDSRFGEEWGMPDAPYAARRFRPLVEDKLAAFRGLLAGGPIQGDFEGPRRTRVKEEEKV